MEDKILSRILNGDASQDEKDSFFESLAQNEEDQEIYYQSRSLWLRTSLQKTKVNLTSEFDDLWKKIQRNNQSKPSLYRKIFQYAAIIVFLLGTGSLGGYFLGNYNSGNSFSKIQHYTSMKGSVSTIEFSDGTKVWLNSDSKLSYHFDEKGGNRLAELSGEAYFEVVHNDKFPFLVKVGELTVRDLGTTFNIKGYPDDKYIETSLIEGKVDLLNKENKMLLDLNPGERAIYYPEQNKIETSTVSINAMSAWRNGKLSVRDQKLEDIFKEMSRWYDIEFRFEKEELRNQRFTGIIKKSTSVESVLSVLKQASDFNYRIVEKTDEPDVVTIY